jgi:hypothetical protein
MIPALLRRAAPWLVTASVVASQLAAQGNEPLPSGVVFNLRQAFLAALLSRGADTAHSVGARYAAQLQMGDHSGVHALASDCELHAAGRPQQVIAEPRGLVVEPPNVCKRRIPQLGHAGGLAVAWTRYFDEHVTGQPCEVTGFPRIFTEHSSGAGGESSSNPDHVVEIHPAIAMTCGTEQIDLLPNLTYFKGMRAITPLSTIACLNERRLSVRMRTVGGEDVYEFAEAGAKTTAGRCGNFVIVDAHVGKEYLRELTNGGDHTALARVWVGEAGPFPLKIYTYKGTPADGRLATLMASSDDAATVEFRVHGLLTYDYFTIAQAVQRGKNDWLPADSLRDWKLIDHPLGLVVFGIVPP